MPDRIRVVVDTNLWISCMIGKRLEFIRLYLEDKRIENVMSLELLREVTSVALRPKFRRYFSEQEVHDMEAWLLHHSYFSELGEIPTRCRDPKDDYLLELAIQAKAIYLVSGDDDLLSIGEIEGCRIMTFTQFINELSRL